MDFDHRPAADCSFDAADMACVGPLPAVKEGPSTSLDPDDNDDGRHCDSVFPVASTEPVPVIDIDAEPAGGHGGLLLAGLADEEMFPDVDSHSSHTCDNVSSTNYTGGAPPTVNWLGLVNSTSGGGGAGNATAGSQWSSAGPQPVPQQSQCDVERRNRLTQRTLIASGVNSALCDTVDQIVHTIQAKLDKIKSAEREVRTQARLRHHAPAGKSAGQKSQKVPTLLYIPPYFRDGNGMAPPLNAEQRRKRAANEFDPLVQPPKKWLEAECVRLKKAVRDEILRVTQRPYASRKELLGEKIASSKQMEMAPTPGQMKSWKNEIRVIDNQLEKIRREIDRESGENFKDQIDWLGISVGVFNGQRTVSECQLKWYNELCPRWTPAGKKWSPQEKARLLQLVVQHEAKSDKHWVNWDHVAADLKTRRTPFQCFQMYQTETQRRNATGKWTPEDDEQLTSIVNSVKIGNFIPWEQVTYYMETRQRSQCIQRWQRIDSSHRTGRWTKQEDDLLLAMVNQFGPRSYARIAAGVPGRTEAQCRERLVNALLTNVGKWTGDEDKVIMDGVNKYGNGAWSRISSDLSGRSPMVVKNRYRTIMRYKKRGYDSPLSPKRKAPVRRHKRPSTGDESSDDDDDDGGSGPVARDKVVRNVDDTLAELQQCRERAAASVGSETEAEAVTSDDDDDGDSEVVVAAPAQRQPCAQVPPTSLPAADNAGLFPQALTRALVGRICAKLAADFRYDEEAGDSTEKKAKIRAALRVYPKNIRSKIKTSMEKVVTDFKSRKHTGKRKRTEPTGAASASSSGGGGASKRIKPEAPDAADAASPPRRPPAAAADDAESRAQICSVLADVLRRADESAAEADVRQLVGRAVDDALSTSGASKSPTSGERPAKLLAPSALTRRLCRLAHEATDGVVLPQSTSKRVAAEAHAIKKVVISSFALTRAAERVGGSKE